MDDLRVSLLKQELQKETLRARELERMGKHKEAGLHYIKAGAIYRKIAFLQPKEKSERMMQTAAQYEQVGAAYKTGAVKKAADMQDISPEIYEEAISNLIVTHKPETVWNDIGGLDGVKREIKEAIILPFVKDIPPFVKSTRTILLYGPPGTGKTMLAKASANTLDATFFEARVSALLSKYFGESNKLIAALFNKARKMEPSLIFIDEIDAIAVRRTADVSEAGRRVMSQVLSDIDGFNTGAKERVLIMSATNKPWDLDEAAISRFQRRVYVPLPDDMARKSIIKIHLNGAVLGGDVGTDEIVAKSRGFSGRDIATLCQQAIMHMVRGMNPGLEDLTSTQAERYQIKHRPLVTKDFEAAFASIRPSVTVADIKKYEEWGKEFGE